MKRLLGLFTSVVLALTLAFSLAACKNDSSNRDEEDKAYNVQYELDDNEEYYTLKSFTVSEEARKLADKNDYEGLAELFNGELAEGETAFTEDTVKTFTVKSEYKGKPVKKIASSAISSLAFIEKIVVPDSIEEIGANAFYQLTGLKEITLPFTGNKVGAISSKSSFGYIFGTTSADGLTSCAQTYADASSASTTYYIPSNLKTVTITGKNEKVATEKWVKNKITRDVNGKVIDIAQIAAEEGEVGDDGKPAYKITVYNDVDRKLAVPAYAFYNVTTIETVVLSDELTALENYTFYGCSALKTVTALGVKTVGDSAFESCSSLKSVAFGGTAAGENEITFANVETIGKNAFKGCTALGKSSDVTKHPLDLSTVTEIGDSAFGGCTGLTSVKLKSGVVLDKRAFSSCSALETIENADAYVPKRAEDKNDPSCNPFDGTKYQDNLDKNDR